MKFVIAHEHCGVCGACFLHAAQLHRCPGAVDEGAPDFVDPILEVFRMETRERPARSRFQADGGDSYAERLFKASHT